MCCPLTCCWRQAFTWPSHDLLSLTAHSQTSINRIHSCSKYSQHSDTGSCEQVTPVLNSESSVFKIYPTEPAINSPGMDTSSWSGQAVCLAAIQQSANFDFDGPEKYREQKQNSSTARSQKLGLGLAIHLIHDHTHVRRENVAELFAPTIIKTSIWCQNGYIH